MRIGLEAIRQKMRRYQQKQILEVLGSIAEAQSLGRHADCQDGVDALCTFINEICGEGTQTVALLREHDELLFRAHNGEIGEKILRRHLIKIENSVRHELAPTKVEVVFISYKASMSDSIESIYLAAKADPACDAYWIPVPYFDKNADGTLGMMHHEGAEYYPDYIECTNWQQYDMEQRCPDVIFTFAPYDAGNFVTSIHPDYYCERLRGLTDLLIYVPYFVVGGDLPEHFVTIAGCVHAHKVIVESEAIRQSYIHIFKKAYGDMFGKPEEKFLTLGSPKFDKVMNAKREDFSLPQEWRDLIADKKVIFYNTTVGAILMEEERYLQKVRQVLDMFCERADVILWWRPHPLNEATLQSMRPQLVAEYKQIIEDYKHAGRGILDETPDLHRAIAWTDAYYGDYSSVVALYQSVEKPIMIQLIRVHNSTEYYPISFCQYSNGDHVYFADERFNALYRMHKPSLVVEYLGEFPDEQGDALYRQMAQHNGKLYFTPCKAQKVGVYDLEKQEFCDGIEIKNLGDSFKLGKHTHKTGDYLYSAFAGAISYKQYIYFTPMFYPAIVRLDTDSGEIQYIDDFMNSLGELVNSNEYMFARITPVSGISFALACHCANAFMRFKMETNTTEIIKIDDSGNRYIAIIYDGNSYWLCPARVGMPIIKWCDGECMYFNEYHSNDLAASHIPFVGGFYCDEYIYFIPYQNYKAIKIHVHTNELSIAHEFDKFIGNGYFCNFFTAYEHSKGRAAGFQANGHWLDIDFNKKTLTQDAVVISPAIKNTIKDLHNKHFDLGEKLTYENYTTYLDSFITQICQKSLSVQSKDEQAPNAGDRIWKYAVAI